MADFVEVDELLLRELRSLSDSTSDLRVSLEDCPNLLGFLPATLASPDASCAHKASQLYLELLKIADRQFHRFNAAFESTGEIDIALGSLLAGCALIGVVTDRWEKSGTATPSKMESARQTRKGARREIAASWIGLSARRVQDRDESLLKILRNKIREHLIYIVSSRDGRGTHRIWFDDRYIRRSDLESQFAELITQHHQLIAFVGPPGMGKTWLARQPLSDFSHSNAWRQRYNPAACALNQALDQPDRVCRVHRVLDHRSSWPMGLRLRREFAAHLSKDAPLWAAIR